MTLLFSQVETLERPLSLELLGQALWLHSAPHLSHLSLPFPPPCLFLIPLIGYAAALE